MTGAETSIEFPAVDDNAVEATRTLEEYFRKRKRIVRRAELY